MLSPHVWLCVFLIRTTFALQVPRQAKASYTNSSTTINATASAALVPDCCEVYAVGVILNYWYTGHNVSVNNGTQIVEYLRYSGKCLQIATTNVDGRAMSSAYTRIVLLYGVMFEFICRLTIEPY